jgi:tRNA (uracil-5-)-methyltransferase TRM9
LKHNKRMTTNIKDVYNHISQDFDKTRYSVWKGVRKFLDTLQPETTLCEVGTGNGKNLLYRKDIKTKGYDISKEFVKICKKKNLDVDEGDILNLNVADNYFDNVICIAVIHHLETKEERIKAISELIRITNSGGSILIYVWAYEQPLETKRKFVPGDNLVTFQTKDNVLHKRFYHMYVQGEIEEEINCLTIEKKFNVRGFWEKGNWCVVISIL